MTPTEAARAAAEKIEVWAIRDKMAEIIATEFTTLLAERDATIAELQREIERLTSRMNAAREVVTIEKRIASEASRRMATAESRVTELERRCADALT